MAWSNRPYNGHDANPRSYDDCAKILATRRRKLANNTYLVPLFSGHAVRLHSTYIVTFRKSGAVVLSSGGWQTVTTRERMRRYLPPGIHLESMRDRNGSYWIVRTRAGIYPFKDGMRITASGRVYGAGVRRGPETKAARAKRLKAARLARIAEAARIERRKNGTARAYHFTRDTLRDGAPLPARGAWLEYPGAVVICSSGYHASERLVDAERYAPEGWTWLHLVDVRGIEGEHHDKLAARARRIVASISRARVAEFLHGLHGLRRDPDSPIGMTQATREAVAAALADMERDPCRDMRDPDPVRTRSDGMGV